MGKRRTIGCCTIPEIVCMTESRWVKKKKKREAGKIRINKKIEVKMQRKELKKKKRDVKVSKNTKRKNYKIREM